MKVKERKSCRISFAGQTSRTKQSFKDECDINQILAKYQTQGIVDHINKHEPQYGETTSLTYQDSMQIVAKANSMFEELPATVRKRFNNQPEQFLDFVQNPENKSELQKMGLLKTPFLEDKKAEGLPKTPAPGGKAPLAGEKDSDASASDKTTSTENKTE